MPTNYYRWLGDQMTKAIRLLLVLGVLASGVFVFSGSASAADDCAPGTYSTDGTTDTGCMPCPAGTFQSAAGATECTPCPAGTYQDQIGQVSCNDAMPGSFVAGEGAALAEFCQPGTFQDLAGQVSCNNAPAGYYVAGFGSIEATACDIDTFSDFEGSAACQPCPAGTSTNGQIAQTECTVVPPPPPALPTSKDDCKKGGWQAFGVFKNQGDCVSYVATGGKNGPANS